MDVVDNETRRKFRSSISYVRTLYGPTTGERHISQGNAGGMDPCDWLWRRKILFSPAHGFPEMQMDDK